MLVLRHCTISLFIVNWNRGERFILKFIVLESGRSGHVMFNMECKGRGGNVPNRVNKTKLTM